MTADKSPAEILKELIEQLDRRVFPENAAKVLTTSTSDYDIRLLPRKFLAAYITSGAIAFKKRRLVKWPTGFLIRLFIAGFTRFSDRKRFWHRLTRKFIKKCSLLIGGRLVISREFYLISEENTNRYFNPPLRFFLLLTAAHEVRHRLQVLCPKAISYGAWAKFRRMSWVRRELGISRRRYLSLLIDYPFLGTSRARIERDSKFIEEVTQYCADDDWDKAMKWDKIVKIVKM